MKQGSSQPDVVVDFALLKAMIESKREPSGVAIVALSQTESAKLVSVAVGIDGYSRHNHVAVLYSKEGQILGFMPASMLDELLTANQYYDDKTAHSKPFLMKSILGNV